MLTTIALILSAGLLLANGFFVASEFAMVKMRPTKLEDLVRRRDPRARVAQKISRNLDAYLSANQLGITLSSLALGWIGEPAFAALFEPLFTGLASWSVATTHAAAVVASFALITFLHTVIGELAPKSLAIQRTERVALWTAVPLRAFYFVMFPVIWTLNAAAGLFLSLLGLGRRSDLEKLHSPEELRLFLRGGDLLPGPRDVMDRLFDYTNRTVAEIMTRVSEVVSLDLERPWKENLRTAIGAQFSRYPVVQDGRFVGYVHLKDLLAAFASRRSKQLRAFVRTPLRVREGSFLEELRRDFLASGVHLAIVENAAGQVVGIVTLEDLLEEFIGEIRDEHDASEVAPIVRREDGSFVATGRLTLDVAARELDLVFDDAPAPTKTLADYVSSHAEKRIKPGTTVSCGDFLLTVLEMRAGIIERIAGRRSPRSPVSS
jgi:CBS domain containing-hemolysin-like protein